MSPGLIISLLQEHNKMCHYKSKMLICVVLIISKTSSLLSFFFLLLLLGRAPEYRPMSSPPSEAPPSPSHKHRGHWVKQPRPQLPRQISDKSETFDPTAPLTKQKYFHFHFIISSLVLLFDLRNGSISYFISFYITIFFSFLP